MNKRKIYNRLMAAVNNPFGVCGLMGNMVKESNLRANNMQNCYEDDLNMTDESYTAAVDSGSYTDFCTDRVGYGLCQWTSAGRKTALLSFAIAADKSIGDEDMQVDFAIHELKTSYKSVLEVLKKATGIKEASDFVCRYYERPADQSTDALRKRQMKGEEIYDELMQEELSGVKKTVRYQKNNGAYTSGRTIKPVGEMVHSYGCAQPDPNVLAEKWDSAGANACVHAHIGKDEIIITLPCMEKSGEAVRGWHAGGAANNTHLSAEMTEPATIKYIGGSNWIELADGSNTKAHVLATYANAVQLFAEWCVLHHLDPLADGVVISHSEGHRRGVASNHGDVEHLWRKFGLTMAQFRKDINAAMGGAVVDFGRVEVTDTAAQGVNKLEGTLTVIYGGEDGLNIRTAPAYDSAVSEIVYNDGKVYRVVGISADEKWYKLSDGRFVTAIPEYVMFKATEEQKQSTAGTGYFRVRKAWEDKASQIGAFKSDKNAIDICCQNEGYRVYDNDGTEIYPCLDDLAVSAVLPQKVRVLTDDLKIRKGAGTTYDYHKLGGEPRCTGKNVLTIVEVADGPGAKRWGLLKAYAKNRNGWIPLDDCNVACVK